MNSEASTLDEHIRLWLSEHPLDEGRDLDVHGIPADLFDLAEPDLRLRELNRQIRELPLKLQKLLLYLARDTEPGLIIETLEYPSPELFWLDKAVLVKVVDPKARQQDVLNVYAVNGMLLDRMLETADALDREADKRKSKKMRRWSLAALPLVLLLLYLVVYPMLFRPDPAALYESFRTAYRPDWSRIDTTGLEGGNYLEAMQLMDDGRFSEAASLFEELLPAAKEFRSPARWFLALINLHNGDRQGTEEQLKAIRAEDPGFYREVAEKLDRKL